MKTKKISLRITESTDKTINLTKLLKQTIDPSVDKLAISMTIAPKVSLQFTDDLAQIGIHNCSLEITLDTDSFCATTMKFLCPLLMKSAKCTEHKSKHNPKMTRAIKLIHAGRGAHSKTKIRFAGSKGRTFDIDSTQEHKAPNTSSYLSAHTVLADESSLTCNTLVKIDPQAQNVEAKQYNKNLLIGNTACVKTSPQLEVSAHRVKCRHGSATGRISQQQLFYLKTRGINKESGKQLISGAFLR